MVGNNEVGTSLVNLGNVLPVYGFWVGNNWFDLGTLFPFVVRNLSPIIFCRVGIYGFGLILLT